MQVVAGLIIIIASILDAIFTLGHLEAGGVEFNPIMSWALTKGVVFFWIFKMLITVGGVGVLLWFDQYTHLARKGLWGLAIAYICLVIYHLFIRN